MIGVSHRRVYARSADELCRGSMKEWWWCRIDMDMGAVSGRHNGRAIVWRNSNRKRQTYGVANNSTMGGRDTGWIQQA